MSDRLVQVVCEEDDSRKTEIAKQLNLIHAAIENDTVVGISCLDTSNGEDVTVLAVMTKDDGAELVGYAPIGILVAPESDRLKDFIPKLGDYIEVDGSDVKH